MSDEEYIKEFAALGITLKITRHPAAKPTFKFIFKDGVHYSNNQRCLQSTLNWYKYKGIRP